MNETNDKYEQNISRLIKCSRDSEIPSKEFTEQLVSKALDQLELKDGKSRSKITIGSKVAAAVLIVLSAAAFLFVKTSNEDINVQIGSEISHPARFTVASVTFAYQQGGLEAIDKMYIESLKRISPGPRTESFNDLFAELTK